MADDCKWTAIIYLLYDNEIFELFEAFVKKNEIISSTDKVVDMPIEQLSSSLKLFLDTLDDTQIKRTKKSELLTYC